MIEKEVLKDKLNDLLTRSEALQSDMDSLLDEMGYDEEAYLNEDYEDDLDNEKDDTLHFVLESQGMVWEAVQYLHGAISTIN